MDNTGQVCQLDEDAEVA